MRRKAAAGVTEGRPFMPGEGNMMMIRRRLVVLLAAVAAFTGMAGLGVLNAAPAMASVNLQCNAHQGVTSPCLYQGSSTGATTGVVYADGSPTLTPCNPSGCVVQSGYPWTGSEAWLDSYYNGKPVVWIKFTGYNNVCEGNNSGATCGDYYTSYVYSGQDQYVNVHASQLNDVRLCMSSFGYTAQVYFAGCDGTQWPQVWYTTLR